MQRHPYKFIIFLSIFYSISWSSAYLMVYKMVAIGNIPIPGAVFLFPLSFSLADVITEVYGYRIARQILWSGIICGFIFCVAVKLVAGLPSPTFWHLKKEYDGVFGLILRAYSAVTLGNIIGSSINIYIISKWKIILHGKYFWIRSLCSTAIGEFAFSVVGALIGFAGVEPSSKILWLMLGGYSFKMIYAFIAIWPAVALAKLLKQAEGVDIYDYNVNYNLFKLSIND